MEKESLIGAKNKLNRQGIKGIITGFIGIFSALIILLISAGEISWLNGWLFFGLILGYEISYVALFLRVNPRLLNERGKLVSEESKRFEKIFAILYLPLYFSVLIISGIDARYGWTIMPLWVTVFGVIMFLLASSFSFWAMYSNPYFECTLRTQEDQKVVNTGPYKIVRHSGYLAGIISFLAAPIILGSWWGFIPSLILTLALVIRTKLEDSTLQRELPGYKEYTKTTPYRLLPMIW